jgi:hypothetical protein
LSVSNIYTIRNSEWSKPTNLHHFPTTNDMLFLFWIRCVSSEIQFFLCSAFMVLEESRGNAKFFFLRKPGTLSPSCPSKTIYYLLSSLLSWAWQKSLLVSFSPKKTSPWIHFLKFHQREENFITSWCSQKSNQMSLVGQI